MALDPYLRSAYYGAFQSLQRLDQPQRAASLVDEYQRLENNPRSHLAEFKYTRMGHKGEALAIDLARGDGGPVARRRALSGATGTGRRRPRCRSAGWRRHRVELPVSPPSTSTGTACRTYF